ncbi:MAG: thioredoxin domain-containing protein [Deltaproteobacteria bacterium]|nr:thioredoxin domain-containing protein [Deltaproteobacteria bacterium]
MTPNPKLALVGATALALASLSACSTTESKAAPVAAAARVATSCAQASLALPADAVIGSIDGKAVKISDLGDELRRAEEKALWEYCDAVSGTRSRALEGYATEKLVEAAAAKAGGEPEAWVRAEVEKRSAMPTDAEVQAFYDSIKPPDAPPLEVVKPRVVMLMQQERAEKAARALFGELRAQASVTTALPDVRSPPRDVDLAPHTARKGAAGAKVRVVEFADFQCPYCSRAAETMHALAKRYGDRVEFAYRHFPLRSIHPDADRAAQAAQCAARQGKFWEMHDKLYGAQSSLDDEAIVGHGKELGLDTAKLEGCMKNGEAAAEVEADLQKASELGVEGTPSFFINGRPHLGNPSEDALAAAIDAELAR